MIWVYLYFFHCYYIFYKDYLEVNANKYLQRMNADVGNWPAVRSITYSYYEIFYSGSEDAIYVMSFD